MLNLLKNITEKTKSNYRARTDEKNKLFKNIANYGANYGSKGIVGRNGEYYGLTIEFLERVKPLFTDHKIIRSLEYIEKSNFLMAVRILDIEDEFNNYGNSAIFYTIENWFILNNIDTKYLCSVQNFNTDYNKNIPKQNSLLDRLKTQRQDPINFSIKIVGLGKSNKGNSVVPESWLGKEFKSCEELHKEMNNLDWRKNKPPVNYCCTYSMSLIEDNNWLSYDQIIKTQMESNNLIIITCFIKNNKISTNVDTFEDPITYISHHDKNSIYYYESKKELLICLSPNIFKKKTEYVKEHSVSILVSRLQKSFRRGSKSSKILYSTIEHINNAPFYNLPDQHFAKVSGTRQLFWRSYISIIEDVAGYHHKNIYDLMDIFVLALICHVDPNLQIEDKYLRQLQDTLLNVQSIEKSWPWRKGIEVPMKKFETYGLNCDNYPPLRIIDSMILSLKYMPMMSGDRSMLFKCINYISENNFNLNNINYNKPEHYLSMSNDDIEKDVMLSTYDMHCCPSIILTVQGSIPFIPTMDYTTNNISGFIWDYSSKFNIRYSKREVISENKKLVLSTVRSVQQNYLKKNEPDEIKNIVFEKNKINKIIKSNKIPCEISRLGFILLFGQKIKLPYENKNNPSIEIIVAGDVYKPCRIKKYSSINNDRYNYLEGKERFEGEKRYIKFIEKGIYTEIMDPPLGFKWNINKKIKIRAAIINSDENNYFNNLSFFVNDIQIQPFNSSIFLEHIGKYEEIELEDKFMIEIIENAVYTKYTIDGLKLNILMRSTGDIRNNLRDYRVFNIAKYFKNSELAEIWRQLYSRMHNSKELEIGPVDRMGNKTHNSISYRYEGVFWRFLNLLYMLYPAAFILKNNFKFELNICDPSYYNMMNVLHKCAFPFSVNYELLNTIEIKTKLWEHQEKTANKIFNDMVNNSVIKRGFGDASNVGTGKTLTALSLISKLYNYNKKNIIKNYRAFLVMVPNIQLYDTWINEIKKHTEGFDIILQNANGSLTKNNIESNSIVISTMSRTREHPISNPWILIIIDECLTVQNKEALQTEEALRQSVSSQYNCVLLSATFFRTRFDKLFYMLKMLRTGIPEKIEYLDSILSESMVCNITENNRKWISDITKYELSKNILMMDTRKFM